MEYVSARQRDVTSELVVSGGHVCLENQDVISEVLANPQGTRNTLSSEGLLSHPPAGQVASLV